VLTPYSLLRTVLADCLPAQNPGPDALPDHYGYLLGTVDNGSVQFEFQEVGESDVPQAVRQQCPPTLISGCFARNSQNQNPASEETTNRCYGQEHLSRPSNLEIGNPERSPNLRVVLLIPNGSIFAEFSLHLGQVFSCLLARLDGLHPFQNLGTLASLPC
jgi:hypothetical protein